MEAKSRMTCRSRWIAALSVWMSFPRRNYSLYFSKENYAASNRQTTPALLQPTTLSNSNYFIGPLVGQEWKTKPSPGWDILTTSSQPLCWGSQPCMWLAETFSPLRCIQATTPVARNSFLTCCFRLPVTDLTSQSLKNTLHMHDCDMDRLLIPVVHLDGSCRHLFLGTAGKEKSILRKGHCISWNKIFFQLTLQGKLNLFKIYS